MKAEKKPTTLIYVYCRGQREEKEDIQLLLWRSGYTSHFVYINVYITVSHVQVYISNMLARYIFQQSWGGDQNKLTFRAEGFCISDSSLLWGKKIKKMCTCLYSVLGLVNCPYLKVLPVGHQSGTALLTDMAPNKYICKNKFSKWCD